MAEAKKIIKAIGNDPDLLNQLINASSDDERLQILRQRGILGQGEDGPTPEEMQEEIEKALGKGRGGPADDERMVEWVAAIGTAAAGAAAAACAAE